MIKMDTKIDLKDKKILYELDRNSRQSNSEIGKKVGLSKDTVNYRIKKLEQEKFTLGYYTLIDSYALGYITIRTYLKLINLSPKKEEEIIDFLVKNKKVFFVFKVDGEYDLAFGTWAKNIYEFEDLYFSFKKHFKKFIGEEKMSIFTRAHHFSRNYLLENKSKKDVEIIGGPAKKECDAKDKSILKLLAKNARLPTMELATILKTPAATIAHRIKQLERKKIVRGYRISFNFEKYGYEYYKVDIELNDFINYQDIVDYLYAHPNVIYLDETIGGSDIEFDIEVKNKKQLTSLLDELKEKFSGIRKTSYFTARKYYKLLYIPED